MINRSSYFLTVAQNLQNIIQEQIAQNLGATPSTTPTTKVRNREEVASGDRAGPTPPPRPSQLQQPHQQQQQQQQQQHPALMILATALMQAQTGEEASILQNPQVVGFLQDVVMQAESERSVSELLGNPALGPLFGASPAVLPPATTMAPSAVTAPTTSTRWGPSTAAAIEAAPKDSDAVAVKRPALLGQAPGPQMSSPLTVNTATVATPSVAVPPAKDTSPTPPIVKNNLNNLLNTQNLNQLLGSLTDPQQLSAAAATGAASIAATTSSTPSVPAVMSVSASSNVPGSSVITPALQQPDPQSHLFNPGGSMPPLSTRRVGQRPVLLSDPPSLPPPPHQRTPHQGVPLFPRPTTATAQVGQGSNHSAAAAAMMLSSTAARPTTCPPTQSQGVGSLGAQQAMAMAAAAAAATNNPYHLQQQQQHQLQLQQQLQHQQQTPPAAAMAANPFFQHLQQNIPGLGITGPPPSQAFLFGASPHNPLLSAQMMAPHQAAAAAAAAAAATPAALQQQYASYLMGGNGGAAAVNPYLAAMSPPPPVSNPQLAVGAQMAAAMSTPPMVGMKRKLTIPPSPEQSPDGRYIGQHSQGLGGHYADSYWTKKAKYN